MSTEPARRHPVDEVMDLAWGKRLDRDQVVAHLSSTYGLRPSGVTDLDTAWRIDLGPDEPSWIARVYRPERTLDSVRADAAMLFYLEGQDFPAERCAHPDPVTTFAGHAVLVTRYIPGEAPEPSPGNLGDLGALAGRLAALAPPPPGVGLASDVGAFTEFGLVTSLRAELSHASECLASVGDDVPPDQRETYERLCHGVEDAADFAGLPTALVHPDLGPINAIATPTGPIVPIDWAGAGIGPRPLTLGILIGVGWALGYFRDEGGEFDLARLRAITSGFTDHTSLSTQELDLLPNVIRHRPLVVESFGFSIGVRLGTSPLYAGWWTADGKGLDYLAVSRSRTWPRRRRRPAVKGGPLLTTRRWRCRPRRSRRCPWPGHSVR